MGYKGDLNTAMKKVGLTPIGLAIGVIAFVVSGAWVVFLPIACIVIVYFIVRNYTKNKFFAAFLSYYLTSVIMSIMGILIYYFPDTFGGGLFESGYILADFMTLNSIIDWIIKIETDSWGIVYNWILVTSAIMVIIVNVFLANRGNHSLRD